MHKQGNKQKEQEILVIADDFGMSKGVNKAIIELAENGNLGGVSVMTTAKFFEESIAKLAEIRSKNGVKIGLHLDLTYGKGLYKANNSLVKNGVFKNSFIKIFLMSFFRKTKLKYNLAKEIKAQIKFLKQKIGHVDYIDGHQHIHFIPLVFQIVKRIARAEQVGRIRIINESFLRSFDLKNPPSPIAIIKFLVLEFCFLANKINSSVYFYSILYSCKFDQKSLKNFLRIKSELKKSGLEKIELMIHPGYSRIDEADVNNREFRHITSKNRDLEREAAFKLLQH